jgi:UDP-N-acetylglucosamine 3-dehydrogenase
MNKPLRFGLIGLGYFGKNYLRLLQEIKGAELSAVCNKEEKAFLEYSSLIQKTVVKTTDANTILENPEIDCVVIATPPGTHLELAMKALQNGKHVLLEKPMTPTLEEAKNLRDAVKKTKLTFMVGHQYCYNDHLTWLHDNINLLGKPSLVIANHLYSGPIRKDIGCFFDAGTHQLSMIQYLLNPGRVVEAEGRKVSLGKNRIEDFATATARFENGLVASITTTWLSPEKTRKFSIFGSKKTAVFDDVDDEKLRIYTSSSSVPEIPKVKAKEPLRNQVEHFIESITKNQIPTTNIDKSLEIAENLDKIWKSLKD